MNLHVLHTHVHIVFRCISHLSRNPVFRSMRTLLLLRLMPANLVVNLAFQSCQITFHKSTVLYKQRGLGGSGGGLGIYGKGRVEVRN